jgi:hypothetical protein
VVGEVVEKVGRDAVALDPGIQMEIAAGCLARARQRHTAATFR